MKLERIENSKAGHFINSFGLFTILVLCIAVYVNGLFGGFLLDDYANIVENNLLQLVDGTAYHWWLAALSSDSGILRRPVSMLSFAVNIYLFGMSPVAFKIVNLVIHLLNGVLLYRLSLRLIPYLRPVHTEAKPGSQGKALALFVTALWLLHPLNVSNVLYVVQRMNQLATLFTLAGLYCYVEGRRRSLQNEPGLLVAFSGLITFGILATLSKENGALIVLYALVIEAVCFRLRGARSETQKPVAAFFLLTLALPFTLVATYLLIHPEWLTKSYAVRDFTLAQRLLTEPRIMLHYLQWIFIPLPSSMGLYHDDIPLSTGLFTLPSTAAAIGLLAALAVLAWKARIRMPSLTFGVAWFFAGHVMESTILPLVIVFEHRNYLPMAGLLLGCTIAVAQTVDHWSPKVIKTVCVVLIATLAGLTANRSYDWGDQLRLALTTAKDHPDSPRSLYDAGRATIYAGEAAGALEKVRGEARSYFLRAMHLDKTYVFPSVAYTLTYFGGKEIPESAISDLEFRLRETRSFPTAPFLALLSALADGSVLIPPKDVDRLVYAALDNHDTNAKDRAMILNNYAEYQFNIQHDAQTAISLTLAAAEIVPSNPFFQVNVANLALTLEQPEIAKQHVDKAEALDVTGQYAKQIGRIKSQIEHKPDS
jgi:hypothetical protein